MKATKLNLRVVSRIVFAYMIFAFSWWAVHLWQQNEVVFHLETKILEHKFAAQKQGLNLTQFSQTAEFQQLDKKYHSRHKMILGEGVFFTLCLLFGLWVINRSANREVALARQRRNFLLSITHELKSPIAGISLALETIARRELPRESLEKMTSGGLRETARLEKLVNDILLAARLEEKWQPMPEAIDLKKLVGDIVSNLKIRFQHADIQWNIAADLPPLQADRPGFTAVVQNLLENALKYSPEGSPVVFTAQKTASGRTHIRVEDLGPGIPTDEKRRVFEKFYRIGNEETRLTKGTGLGLYIVRQVVEAHGGSIQILDNQPNGSIFSIEI